ncbi:MAG: InlB B-repeat-containing protein, partial [Actinomycetota bacterium]
MTSSPSGDNEKHGVMLFTADGVLDTSFDGDGRRKIASGGPNMDVWTTAVTVTSDDKIMIVGTSPDNSWDYRMKVYRLNTDGSLDTSFNNDGMRNVYFPSSVDNLANAVVMSGEKTVFGGSAAASWQRHDMGIGQLTSDGRNDTAFASGDGRTYVDFGFGDSDVRELLVQADGKIIAIGESQVFDNDDSVAVTRLNTDGSLDTSFSDDGKFAHDFGTGDSYGWAGAIDAEGRIVIAGQYNNGVNDKAFVMRLTSAGELDTTFGTGGVRTYDFAGDNAESFNAIAVQGDDMVVAGGSGSDLLVARLTDLYSNTLNITYDSQDGSDVTDGDATTTAGGSIATLPTDPTRTGYTFNGWFTAASGGTQITAGTAHNQTADFNLYAQWAANTLNITYDSQDGSDVTDGDATTTAGGSIATLPTDPTRTGYTFNGWFTAASGGTQITAGTAHNQTADFTLYAQWQAVPTTTTTTTPPTTTTPSTTTTTVAPTTTTTAPPTTTAPTTTTAAPEVTTTTVASSDAPTSTTTTV